MESSMCPGGMESDDDDDFLDDYTDDTVAISDISLNANDFSQGKQTKTIANECKNQNNAKPSRINDMILKQPVKMLNAKVNTTDMVDDMRVAAVRNQVSAAKIYLKQGFKVDTVLNVGWTALMYACSCANFEIVDLFLERGADPNFHSTQDMFTPLMAACSSKQKNDTNLQKCVESLVNAGANVDDYERHHETALMFATREGRLEIVSYLVKNNASLDFKNNRGWTALFWAACKGYGKIVRILLENNADATIVSFSGQKASDLANSYGFLVIGKILQDYTDTDKSSEFRQNLMKDLPVKDEKSIALINNSFVSYGELEMFLMGLNLQDLIPLFNNHEIKFSMLLKMDENDLEKIGVDKHGNRINILKAVAALHKKDWKKSSFPDIKNKVLVTCEDIVHIIYISSQHISFIDSSVHYVQKRMVKNPQILQLDKDKADIQTMENLTDTSLENCERLLKQLKFLKAHFVNIRNNVEHLPVDHINEDDNYKKTNKGSPYWRYGAIVVVMGLFGYFVNKEKINIVIKQHPWL